MTRHNKLRDGVADLSVKTFTPSYVRNGPLIQPSHAMRQGNAQQTGSANNNPPAFRDATENKGNLLIHDLWQIGTDSIHKMCVLNTDVISYQNNPPEKISPDGGKT